MKPALLLLPNLIAEHQHHELFLPASIDKAVASIDGLIAESEKGGRRFLSRFDTKKPAHEIPLALYNTNTPDADIDFFLDPIRQGERWGLISDSGLPCIADPGSKIVARAKKLGIIVQGFVGPSSILLSLMQSGLPGQSFAFHGYLEKEEERFKRTVKQLESESRKRKMTQIFMERPYHNQQVLQWLFEALHPSTELCVASEITGQNQMILTQPIDVWKKSPPPSLDKRNTLFLFLGIPSPSEPRP